eukprot:11159809-Lingulodinium_polyedra.AAC.1
MVAPEHVIGEASTHIAATMRDLERQIDRMGSLPSRRSRARRRRTRALLPWKTTCLGSRLK